MQHEMKMKKTKKKLQQSKKLTYGNDCWLSMVVLHAINNHSGEIHYGY